MLADRQEALDHQHLLNRGRDAGEEREGKRERDMSKDLIAQRLSRSSGSLGGRASMRPGEQPPAQPSHLEVVKELRGATLAVAVHDLL